MKTIYQSNDGKQFNLASDCEEHERKIKTIPEACLTNDSTKIKDVIEFLNQNIQAIINDKRPLKDFEHYCFEALIDLFFDDHFWEWYNENNEGEGM